MFGCGSVSAPHFGPFVLVGAAGDAAGDGFTTGLGFVDGAFSVGVTGDDTVAGDEVAAAGVAAAGVVLVAGSVAHPAAKRTEESVNARIAVRLITVMFVIDSCLVFARLKSEAIIARTQIGSNGRSHRSCT